MMHPLVKVCVLSQASKQSKLKARHSTGEISYILFVRHVSDVNDYPHCVYMVHNSHTLYHLLTYENTILYLICIICSYFNVTSPGH